MTAKQIIEALVFASPKPLTAKELGAALRSAAVTSEDIDAQAFGKLKESEIVVLLEALRSEYEAQQRAFQLVEKASGWQIVSHPDFGHWVRQLYPESKPTRLSGPALETLAIIAYRQPITKADIEAVRGVSVDGMVQMLLERSLVRIAGRAELPGRPLLYETTQYFMEHFGLKQLAELPNSDELRRIELPKAPIANSEKKQPELSIQEASQPIAAESANENSAEIKSEIAHHESSPLAENGDETANHDLSAAENFTNKADEMAVSESSESPVEADAEPVSESFDESESDSAPEGK